MGASWEGCKENTWSRRVHVRQTVDHPRPSVARARLLTFKTFKGSPVEGKENQKSHPQTQARHMLMKDLRKPFY